MVHSLKTWVDAEPDAEWQIWYEDTFDRETPRQVQATGVGLAAGLVELWRYHLSETVQANGQRGFSRFNLWWKQAGKSVEVVGDWEGMVRLRSWIFQDDLLTTVAAAHSCLIAAGRTSAEIVAAALIAGSREGFETLIVRHLAPEADGSEGGMP